MPGAVSVDPPEWSAHELDIARLRASGWRPTPFRQFLLKVHSRCNLACDYCYVYEMADQRWRAQPATMSVDVVRRAATVIVDHARRHGCEDVRVVLHGGEPLLVGHGYFTDLTRIFQDVGDPHVSVEFTLQSNGVLLDRRMLDELLACGIRIGISLDGDREGSDRHRRHRNGTGSHDATLRGLALLAEPRYRSLFAGILATVDLANEPVATYAHLASFEPPVIDFLLPHGNWSAPPPGIDPSNPDGRYADWLTAAFDRWFDSTTPQPMVRLFESIIALLLGGHSRVESVGVEPTDVLVIETDGAIEHTDSLKSAFEGASGTGRNVFDDDIDSVLDHPMTVARQAGIVGLCATCRGCELVRVCGGGLYAHRYRNSSGFLNPSVYCIDLSRLVRHIGHRVANEISGSALAPT